MFFGPHCEDAIQDSDETGIDCGGSCVASCPGATCSGSAECVTGSCPTGHCELASGPPSWLAGPSLPTARGFLESAVDGGGTIFAVGGTTTSWPDMTGVVPTVDVLAPGATSWSTAPPLLTKRAYHVVAAANGTVYAYGGYSTSTVGLMSIERYAGTWSTGSANSVAAADVTAAAGTDGSIYVVDNDELKIYSPALNSWSTGPTTPTPRGDTGVALGTDGQIYAVGGEINPGCSPACVATSAVDALDTQSLTWTSRAAMQTARMDLASVSAPDGRIYAIAGANTADLISVEAYTPPFGRWTTAASLVQARSAFGAAVAPDGRIYAIAGYSAGSPISSVEIYGPVLMLGATAGTAGAPVAVTAANFAANAPVAVTFDGTLVAVTTSDASGNATATFTVPSLPAGIYTVIAVDDKSQYPVQLPFQIQ
jgi:kelch-like protein 17 (actinfilin)/kelch-like protein 20